MAAEFPTSVANFTNPNPVTDDLDTAVGGLTHSGQHGKVNDEIEATQTKIGTGSSTPTSGKVLRGTGAGTSGWGQIMNEDVDAAADIVETKIKKGANSTVLQTDSTGAIKWATVTSAMIADGEIADTDIKSNADIAVTKLAKGSASTVLTTSSGNAIAWGTVTSAMITNNTIVADDISTTAGIYAAQTDASVARTNLCINGGFEIWQRGATGSTSSSAYTADRWQNVIGAGSTFTSIDREGTTKVSDSQYSLKLVYTNSAQSQVSQVMEDYWHLRGRAVTLSMWVHANAASAARAFIVSVESGSPTYGFSSYHSGTPGWELLTATMTVTSGATQLTVGAWFTGSGTFYLDNAMFNLGSKAATYEPVSPADDLARCQRYYQVLGGTGSGGYPGVFQYASAASETGGVAISYPTSTGGTPTNTKNGTWALTNCTGPTIDSATVNGFRIYATASAAGKMVAEQNSTDDTVTVVWNP